MLVEVYLLYKSYFAYRMKEEVNMAHPKGKYAWTVKVGEKGQIVIPKEARDIFGIKPGDTLIVLGDKKRGIAIPPKNAFSTLAAKLFGDVFPEEDN
jgi:AbrB family looped-hinge helix DNA binding protein